MAARPLTDLPFGSTAEAGAPEGATADGSPADSGAADSGAAESLPGWVLDFIGGGAESIAALREAAQRSDVKRAVDAASKLIPLAEAASAAEVASLARTLCALAGAGETTGVELDAFVREIDRAYRAASRRWLEDRWTEEPSP